MTLSTFVVDDEPLARRKLNELIANVFWADNIGEAADGLAAVEGINAQRPDIIFLDIRMPELSGLEVLERLTCTPATVFTTAHSEFAVAAFDLEAVDYLLKPFNRGRFLAALERARKVVETHNAAAELERARSVLAASHDDSGDGATVGAKPLERVLVRDRGVIVPLPTAEIERLEAQDDYVMIHTRGRHYLLGVRLSELEARLASPPFMRIHRSHIVNLDYVTQLAPYDGVRLEVRMQDGTRVLASRAYSQQIRRMSR